MRLILLHLFAISLFAKSLMVAPGETVRFYAEATGPAAWSADVGQISQSGEWTAPAAEGSATIGAAVGTALDQLVVVVAQVAPPPPPPPSTDAVEIQTLLSPGDVIRFDDGSEFVAPESATVAVIEIADFGKVRVEPTSEPPPPPPPDDPPPPPPIPGEDGNIFPVGTAAELRVMLAPDSPAKPGDTILVQPGVYNGSFRIQVSGTPEAPIRIRSAEGPRVTRIDVGGFEDGNFNSAGFEVTGDYLTIEGFEIMSSSPGPRKIGASGSWVGSILNRGDGIYFGRFAGAPKGKGVRIAGNVIHDTRNGVSWSNNTAPIDVDGNIFYYVGWQGGDRGHGHGTYGKASPSPGVPAVQRRNFSSRNFGIGLRFYGTGSSDPYAGVLDNNVSWNASEAWNDQKLWFTFLHDLQVAGKTQAWMTNNVALNAVPKADGTYHWDGHTFVGAAHAASTPQKDSLVVEGNWIAGADPNGAALQALRYKTITIKDNRIVSPAGTLLEFDTSSSYSFSGNEWWGSRVNTRRDAKTWGWEERFGHRTETLPTGIWAKFIEHPLDPANKVRYVALNWDQTPTVTVDLTGWFAEGDTVDVYAIEDVLGAPVATFVLDSTLTVEAPARLDPARLPKMIGSPLTPAVEAMLPIGPLLVPLQFERQ